MIILQEKSNHNFNNMTREDMYAEMFTQYRKGLMIIPAYFDVVYVGDEKAKEPIKVNKTLRLTKNGIEEIRHD